MIPIRTVTLAVVLAACSRDNPRTVADSLPPANARPADTAGPRAGPDTVNLSGDTSLANSRITVERAAVNGILWGAPGDEVRRTLGAPQTENIVWEEALGDSATVLQYPGLTVRLVESRVVGLHCTTETCITGDAVRVGATRGEVQRVYGRGQDERAGTNPQLAYPFTTDDSCALRFEFAAGKVRAIDVSCHMN